MSGLDPLAALAAETALTQAQVQAIDLGVAVEILQQQLSVGDLLTATVLPSQGGIDLLSIFGTTVAAQLPTGVNPGQSLLLQVTGFQDNQILVQNLGVVDPENPPNTVSVVLPDVAQGAVTQAVVTTILPAAAQTAATPPSAPAPATPSGSVAPPRAVFVAASIAPSAVSRGAAPQEPAAQAPAPPAVPAQSGQPAAPLASEEVADQVAQLGLEARIAATRAASIDIAELVRPATPGPYRSGGIAAGHGPGAAPGGSAARNRAAAAAGAAADRDRRATAGRSIGRCRVAGSASHSALTADARRSEDRGKRGDHFAARAGASRNAARRGRHAGRTRRVAAHVAELRRPSRSFERARASGTACGVRQ